MSLLLWILAVGLWVQSYRRPEGIRVHVSEGQQSVLCHRGLISLWSPPARTGTADEARARDLALRLDREPFAWEVRFAPGRGTCGNDLVRTRPLGRHVAAAFETISFDDARGPLL